MAQEHVDLDALVADREAFNDFVYTPLEEAVEELATRAKEDIAIPVEIPEPFKSGPRALLFRQLITSNYEVRRFVSLVDATNLKPLFWEYYSDKFTSNNEWKHSLGRMFFYKGRGKKEGMQIHSFTVVDFNKFNGKALKDVEVLSGEPLIDFHHNLFSKQYRILKPADYFDASSWFAAHGGSAGHYYASLLYLFVRHGVLFENFMLDAKEFDFTRNVFLPAFMEVYQKTGKKPLVVSLEPTDIEGDRFWICHPFEDLEVVKDMLHKAG